MSIIERDNDTQTPETFIKSHGSIPEDFDEQDGLNMYRYFAFEQLGYPRGFKSKRKMLEFNDAQADGYIRNKIESNYKMTDDKRRFMKWHRKMTSPMYYVDKNGMLKSVEIDEPMPEYTPR